MLSRPECMVSCTGDPPEDKRQITPPRAVTLVPGLPSFGSKAASRSNILLLHLSFQVLCFFSSHPQLISGTPAPANSLGLVASTPVSKGMRSFSTKDNILLISWLQSASAVILEPRKIKSDTVSTVSPSIFYEVMGLDAMIFIFWMLSFKPTFSLSSFTFIKRLFTSSLSVIRVVSSAILLIIIIIMFSKWTQLIHTHFPLTLYHNSDSQ